MHLHNHIIIVASHKQELAITMILCQATRALGRRLHATAPRGSPSLLATSSTSNIDSFVPTSALSKRDIWVWGSPPSNSSNRRGFADAVADNEMTHDSHWAQVPQAPPDPIIGLTEVRASYEYSCHQPKLHYRLCILLTRTIICTGISQR